LLKYRSDIDGLRAVAVLLVVIYHAFPRLLPGGYIGVDLFFVISGYLITSIICKDIHQKTFSFSNFYKRRILRIFPALLTVLFSALVFGYFALTSSEYMTLGKHILAALTFCSNIILWKEVNYFDTASDLKPLLHLWSLAVEEQFYIFWPPLLILVYKLRKNILAIIASVFIMSFFLNLFLIKDHAVSTFYLLPTRAWELIAGAMLAIYSLDQFKGFNFSSRMQKIIMCVVPLFILVPSFLLRKTSVFPGYLALFPIISAILFIASHQQFYINRLISHPVLVFIGRISYPLYLWHWVIFSFARITTPEISNPELKNYFMFLVLIIISGVLSFLTYQIIEKPIRGHHKMVFRLIVAALLLLVLSLGVYKSKGLVFRNAEFEQTHEKVMATKKYYLESEISLKASACRLKFSYDVQYCAIYNESKDPSAILIGDSLANQYYPGLSQNLASKNENLLEFSIDSTPALYRVASLGTRDYSHNDQAFDFISKTDSIKKVILAFSDYTHMDNLKDLTGSFNKDHIYVEALRSTLQFLISRNKEVIFIWQNPPMIDFDHRQCINGRPMRLIPFQVPKICGTDKNLVIKAQAKYRELTQFVLNEFKTVKVFDPMSHLCDDNYCYAYKDEKLLYAHDKHHLSIEGSLWISQFFNF
jgi:peptidoglycan/LPS O-acetylase OafA/YrhL